jgi:acetyl esterase/lipase
MAAWLADEPLAVTREGKSMRYALAVLLLVPALPAFADESKAKTFEVETVKDVAYLDKDADEVRHKFDLYLPKGQKDYPVFFFVHGGGWRGGSKDRFADHGKTFASNGIAFVAVNYRLSPKVKHPEHIKDVAQAFAFAHADLKKRGADLSRIYVSGHSAGGHLCALLACDESHLKAHKLSLKDIKGCIPISGVFTITGTGKMMSEAFGEDKDGWKKASPMAFVAKDRPAMLLFYADKELGQLGKQAEAFVAAMKKAGANAEVKMIKERDHGTIMTNVAKSDDEVTKAIFAFIKGK